LRLKTEAFKVLKITDFRNFIFARFFITLAYMVQAVTVGWQVYSITKEPFSLGLVGLAEAVPSILTALVSGHIIDISDRKKILLSSYMLLLLCSASLLIISTNAINLSDLPKVNAIYIIIFVSGIARGFVMPSTFAFMAQLIPRDLFSRAVTWNITIWQIGAVTGPAIGGLIYGFFGVSIAYSTVVILIGTAIFGMLFVSKKPIPELSGHNTLSDRLTAGIKFVFKNKIILSTITLDLFAVLFGGAVAMLPVYASDILLAGPEGWEFSVQHLPPEQYLWHYILPINLR
jgi:MFS family permease